MSASLSVSTSTHNIAIAFDYSDYYERIATALETMATNSTAIKNSLSTITNNLSASVDIQTQTITPSQPEITCYADWEGVVSTISLYDITGVQVGQRISGLNIAYGTTVLSIAGSDIILSDNTLGSGYGVQLYFYAN